MTYAFGARSLKKLEGVHDDLCRVFHRAIVVTTQDFSIHEGVRSGERQMKLFLQKRSKIDGVTKRGRHMIGEDGFGHAVDAVPYCDGELAWEWDLIFPVCDAVKLAAEELGIPIRWGGTWQEITARRWKGISAQDMYRANPSWDGAHFELPSRLYK